MTNTILYPSKEARDAALKTGMKEGAAQSFDRLDTYVESMVEKMLRDAPSDPGGA